MAAEKDGNFSDCLNNGHRPDIHIHRGYYSVQAQKFQPKISFLPKKFFCMLQFLVTNDEFVKSAIKPFEKFVKDEG